MRQGREGRERKENFGGTCVLMGNLPTRMPLQHAISFVQDQWRRQAWGTGARAPWSLRMHANFAAVQTMVVLIFLSSSVSSKLDRRSHFPLTSNRHHLSNDDCLENKGDYRTARAVLEAIIAFSAMHTYYEQLLQVKQICLCLTRFISLYLDAYVFLCSLVFHCMHVVLL